MRVAMAWVLALGSMLAGRAYGESPVPLVAPESDVPVVFAPPDLEPKARSFSHVGLSIGAGVPSGATAELVFRPWRAVRIEGGAAYDLVSPGLVGGITLAPFSTLIAPVLSVQAGRLFEGDASSLVSVSAADKPLLKHVGYDFASAELGLEIGVPDAFAFSIGAGLAGVQSTVHGISAVMPTNQAFTLADPTVRAIVPAGHLGFVFFI